MAKAKTRIARFVYRSAVTGKFVTEQFATNHPGETIRQEIRRGRS